MNRRDLLRGVAAAGALGTLAGCVSEDAPDESDDGADAGGDPDTTDGDDPTVESLSVVGGELVEANGECAGDDRGTASVVFDDARVTVTGGVGTPDPCYEASLAAPSYDADADELTITVAVTAQEGICQSCLGTVAYEAAVEVDGGLPGTVTVRHERDGETTPVTTAQR
jgi:TAT (twin-arginine translocation) pathway signal sequence.